MTYVPLVVQSTSVPDNQSTLKRQATFENQSGTVESSVGRISVGKIFVRSVLHSFVGRAFRLLLLLVILVAVVPATEAKGSRKSKRVTAPAPSSTVGQFELSFNTDYPPLPPAHASVLPNGKVLHWGLYYFPPTVSRLWPCVITGGLCDPDVAGIRTENIVYTAENLFCSGHSFLPDGRLFVAGGTVLNNPEEGISATTIFNLSPSPSATPPANPGPTMVNGRWYPSTVTLGTGETAILSGYSPLLFGTGNVFNTVPDVLDSTGTTLRRLTGADREIELYPWIHLGSDGRVFHSGPVPPSRWLTTTGTGSWGLTEKPYYYSQVEPFVMHRWNGSSVMYDVDRVLIAGGGFTPPTNTAETINLTNEAGSWTPTGSMTYARRHLNLTILADGKVLATGGTSGSGFNNTCLNQAVFAAELWNPATGLWTTMASGAKRRQYHSIAVLLLDGRVLVAGHTGEPTASPNCAPMADEPQAEIFTPPYLFNSDGSFATRPTISWAPESVTYGQVFPVTAPSSSSINKITIVRLSSVTHGFNMNQRFNQLAFTRVGGGLRVIAPASGNLAPPGHYMMFLINNSGVPSVAKVIQIQ